jgi:menaquinone-dependent protoporphyrinogen oxidase
MNRILLVYGTQEGHTAQIAAHIGQIARDAGHAVEVRLCDDLPPGFSLGPYDAVIVAASVHLGKHERCIQDFVREHRVALEAVPSAFLSVSLSAGGKDAGQQQDAERLVNTFLTQTGWRPARTLTVGGALMYRRYNPLLRFVMRQISSRAGGPTDTSRDYDLTDWPALDQGIREFLSSLVRSASDGT